MTTTKPLSPAAQAVIDFVFEYWPGGHNHPGKSLCVAAVLRATAPMMQFVQDHEKLLAIAAELKETP